MKKIHFTSAFFVLFIFQQSILFGQPEIKVQLGHASYITSVDFSPNGRYAISGSADKTIRLWDVKTGKEIKSFYGHTKRVTAIAFSPNGKLILSASVDNRMSLWDIETTKEIRSFTGHSSFVKSVAFSPDGKYAVSGSYDNSLKIWDIINGIEIKSLIGHTDWVNSVAFSPDGKYIISGSKDNSLKLWEIETGKEIRSFYGHKKEITSVAFSPNGVFVLSGSKDNSLKMWEIATGNEIQNFYGHKNEVTSVAFYKDGTMVLSGSEDKNLKVWEVSSGKEVLNITLLKSIYSFDISPDEKYVLTGGEQSLKLLDISTGKEVWDISKNSISVNSIAFSPKGYYALSALDGFITYWDLNTGKVIRKLEGNTAYSVAFSPDGTLALTGQKSEPKIWDIATGTEIQTLIGHTGGITSVSFSPDGKYALSSGGPLFKAELKLWNIATGEEIKNIGNQCAIKSAVFSPNGKWVLSGSMDKILVLWDVYTGKEIRNFKGHSDVVRSVAFSPDGKSAASGSFDKSLKIWDIATGAEIRTLKGHTDWVCSVAFSPDGKYILSGSSDRNIKLWDASTGKLLNTFCGHSAGVTSVAFCLDGNYFISGSYDGTIRIWNLLKKELVYSIFENSEGEYLAWTPDGYFEGSEKMAKETVYIVNGNNVINIDQLFEQFYQPGIVTARMQGIETFTKGERLTALKLPPRVKITTSEHKDSQLKELVTVTVNVIDQGGGIDEIRLYHNGKIVDGTQRGFKAISKEGFSEIKTFSLRLVNGENIVKATAFNAQRTEAIPDEIIVHYKAPVQVKPTLYIMAIGINNYLNPKYNLNYAQNDAQELVQVLKSKAQSIFEKIELVELYDSLATRNNIIKEIEQIKASSRPEDVFVFFYAGHGVMSVEQKNIKPDYFLIPNNVTQMYTSSADLKNKAISSKELMEFLKDIKAQKQLLLLDACQSGGAVETFAMRGAAEEKAIAQLARSTGTYVIAASGTEQFATEVKELGHGIFTYALLQSLNGNCKSVNSQITVGILKSCIEELVPALSAKHKGQMQFPTGFGFGQDFPIGIVK